MELTDKHINIVQFPTESEMAQMSNYELFEVANGCIKFRDVMVKFITSQVDKQAVRIIDKYDVREIGITERLKNGLLRGNFQFLTDLTIVKKADLMKIKGFGITSYKELLDIMDRYNLKLAD